MPTLLVLLLVVVSLVSALRFADPYSGDYPFFVTAFRNLTNRDGLFVYHWMPNIQSGPVSLLAYGAADVFGVHRFPLIVALSGLVTTGVVIRWSSSCRRVPAVPGMPAVWAGGGLVLLLEWRSLATWGHLDDALVLMIVVVSLLQVDRGRPRIAVLLVGVTLAIKPWAVLLVPVTLGERGPWYRRALPPVLSIGIGGLFWLPFVLASPDTLDGIRPSVEIAADSIVHLVLRDRMAEVPAALRVTQLLLGMVVVWWTVRRRHAGCALLAGIAMRLLFEAATWPYYTAGLVLGAFVWDMIESRWRTPWATLAAAALLIPPWWFAAYDVRAALRLIACLGALELVRRTVRDDRSGECRGITAGGGEHTLVEFDAEARPIGQLDRAAT